MCKEERSKAYGGHAPKNGTVHEPVETLGVVQKLKDLAKEGKPSHASLYAYVPEEEGSVEEEWEEAVGIGKKRQTTKKWTPETLGSSACEKLRRLNWTADSIHRELQNARATTIFKKFCAFENAPIPPRGPSRHPFYIYIVHRVKHDKHFSSDEKKQETLRAIFMLQKLVRKIEAKEVDENEENWRES